MHLTDRAAGRCHPHYRVSIKTNATARLIGAKPMTFRNLLEMLQTDYKKKKKKQYTQVYPQPCHTHNLDKVTRKAQPMLCKRNPIGKKKIGKMMIFTGQRPFYTSKFWAS